MLPLRALMIMTKLPVSMMRMDDGWGVIDNNDVVDDDDEDDGDDGDDGDDDYEDGDVGDDDGDDDGYREW